MSTYIHLREHEPSPAFYAAVARLFEEHENEGTRWVEIHVDGVTITWFAPHPPTEPSDDRA